WAHRGPPAARELGDEHAVARVADRGRGPAQQPSRRANVRAVLTAAVGARPGLVGRPRADRAPARARPPSRRQAARSRLTARSGQALGARSRITCRNDSPLPRIAGAGVVTPAST